MQLNLSKKKLLLKSPPRLTQKPQNLNQLEQSALKFSFLSLFILDYHSMYIILYFNKCSNVYHRYTDVMKHATAALFVTSSHLEPTAPQMPVIKALLRKTRQVSCVINCFFLCHHAHILSGLPLRKMKGGKKTKKKLNNTTCSSSPPHKGPFDARFVSNTAATSERILPIHSKLFRLMI